MSLETTVQGIIEGYNQFQQAHPVLELMLVSEVVYTGGETIAQLISDKKISRPKAILYKAGLAPVYGLMIKGLVESGELVGKYISESPLIKSALGPNLLGNAANLSFFINDTVGEREGYKFGKLGEAYTGIFKRNDEGKFSPWTNLKELVRENVSGRQYLKTTIYTLTLWNAFQTANYGIVPENLRTTLSLAAVMLWIPILSKFSLTGRKEKTGQMLEA